MAADEALAGLQKYFRRTKTLTELRALADQCAPIAQDEVIITTAGIEGATGAGQARGYGKGEILNLLEDLITEMMSAGVTAWTDAQTTGNVRQLFVYADRSEHVCRT